jgi:hypothetical protein
LRLASASASSSQRLARVDTANRTLIEHQHWAYYHAAATKHTLPACLLFV